MVSRSKDWRMATRALAKLIPVGVLYSCHLMLDYSKAEITGNIAYIWIAQGALFTLMNIKIIYTSACNMEFDWFQVEPFLMLLMAQTLNNCEASHVPFIIFSFLTTSILLMLRMLQVSMKETALFFKISIFK